MHLGSLSLIGKFQKQINSAMNLSPRDTPLAINLPRNFLTIEVENPQKPGPFACRQIAARPK
jgi:hypothetical protein